MIYGMLAMGDKAVKKLSMFPKAGTVFLYKCERVEERDNYKANGHRWYQANGKREVGPHRGGGTFI